MHCFGPYRRGSWVADGSYLASETDLYADNSRSALRTCDLAVIYNLRFPGQIYDSQAGLHQNVLRDYDSAIGRYVESDPIGLAGGSNSTYAYTGSAPMMFTDFAGLQIDWGQWVIATVRSGSLGPIADRLRNPHG